MKIASVVLLAFILFSAKQAQSAALPVWHGFIEQDYGGLLSEDALIKHKNYNMLEQRFQLKTRYAIPAENILSYWNGVLVYKGDFVVDEYFQTTASYELRELNLVVSPNKIMDLKAGRQVLTWGTGDYIFVNDMFPKDYISFYIGRDDEYLKKPSDALRLYFYPQGVNIDFVLIPFFTPNTIPDGDRVSSFDSFERGIAGRKTERNAVKPAHKARNIQYAWRLYRNIGNTECAFYYFRGFDPSPKSYLDEARHQLFYERLDVYGSSVRGPFLGGIGNVEMGYLRSRQDNKGDNRLIENSMLKWLFGYEKDLGNDLKIGLQYFFEQRLNYSNYTANLLANDYFLDEYHHVLTQRITKLYRNQTVMLGLFNFWSPSDKDGYLRLSGAYDISDQWKLTVGVNLPWGEDNLTDFGMMKKNKNFFVRLRYSF